MWPSSVFMIFALAIIIAVGGGLGTISGMLVRLLLRAGAIRPGLIVLDVLTGVGGLYLGLFLDYRFLSPKLLDERYFQGRLAYTNDPHGVQRLLIVTAASSVVIAALAEMIVYSVGELYIRSRRPSQK